MCVSSMGQRISDLTTNELGGGYAIAVLLNFRILSATFTSAVNSYLLSS